MTRLRRLAAPLAILALVAFFALALPGTFLTARNWLNISQQASMLLVVAATMTIAMAGGDFDLSVGSMASLAGVAAAVLFVHGWPVWAGVAAALALGLVGGLVNGGLVAYAGLLPFVVTLGTLTSYSGLAFTAAGGKTIFGRDIPAAFGGFARGGLSIGGAVVPNLTIVAATVLALAWVALERRRFGRWLYAIGDNVEAARLAGIPVRRMRLAAFACTGAGGAIAGLMYASRVASANPTQGAGLMLPAIAAVFLGQTMTADGTPRVLATLGGVIVLGVLDNGLTQLSVDSYVREVLVGAIIIGAVWASRVARG
ncbi:MAG: ABC transporter permease [Amaricoccus sp.]